MPIQAQASVVGLKALMRDVDKLCKDERSPLWAAMKQAGYNAVKPVVPATRARLPHSGRKDSKHHKAGLLAGTVRATGYRSGAGVRMGSKKVPYAGWVEFGGKRSRPHESQRPFYSTGRYLFQEGRREAPRAAQEYTKAINTLFGKTAIWTNATTYEGSVHD
jgi:hypothetical protein